MLKYCIKKFYDYFISKIDEKLEKRSLSYLNDEEIKIYNSMGYYDRNHGLNVFLKLEDKNLPKIYLKLAILHDCGKNNESFYLRVAHKLGFNTRLKDHPYNGYMRLINIDKPLAILIRDHHNKDVSDEMKIFQKADDRS